MMAKYQSEQTELKQKVSALHEALAKNTETEKNVGEFIELIGQYADVTKLTPEIIGQLISKIAVHEAKTVDGVKQQRMDIHCRFIGNVNWGL